MSYSVLNPWYLFLLMMSIGSVTGASDAKESSVELRKFEKIYEPSAIQQLSDGRLIILEDEKHRSTSIASFDADGYLSSYPLKRSSAIGWPLSKSTLGSTEDIEGVDIDGRGYVYAITSHSRRRSGTTDKGRERLIRFRVDGNRIIEPLFKKKLKKKVLKKHPALRKAIAVLDSTDVQSFNIEGLSFDKNKQKLLIGFRSPVIDNKAVVVVLDNPAAIFDTDEKPLVSDQLILLDLDKGGIRAIAYDPTLSGYLILSRREDKKGKSFKLWFWDGNTKHDPRRIRIDSDPDIDHAEGITPLNFDGENVIMIVFDDGSSVSRKGAHYLVLRYSQIEVDDK